MATRRNIGFFMIRTGREGKSVLACVGPNMFIYYIIVMKTELVSTLSMEEVLIPPLSVFVGHMYLQRGDLEWNGLHGLRYDMRAIRSEVQLIGGIELCTRTL